jgi:UPF0755 protein
MLASGLTTLAVVVVVVLLWGLCAYVSAGPAARQGHSTTVMLRHGARLPEIAATLEEQGVVRSGSLFVAAAQVTGAARALKAGEYAFPSGASMAEVMEMIRLGKIVRHFVTVPEGLTSEQAVAILMGNDVLSGSAPVPPEGAILPETYQVERGTDRGVVLQRMMTARDRVIAELWPHRQAGLPFKTPEEAVTLASIVEKETARPDERPMVAAVFINRLKKGVPLASDPTIIYGLTRGQPLGHGIRQSELASTTPYNTYHFAGLPPTPISNPGRASIAAVLDPAKTSDLYFVANGTGGHSFAATFQEHEKNVLHWREIERERALAPPRAAMATGGGAGHGG